MPNKPSKQAADKAQKKTEAKSQPAKKRIAAAVPSATNSEGLSQKEIDRVVAHLYQYDRNVEDVLEQLKVPADKKDIVVAELEHTGISRCEGCNLWLDAEDLDEEDMCEECAAS